MGYTSLEHMTDIEGLDYHEDHELFDDTNPGAMLVRFRVKAEVMPYLTKMAADGKKVFKNFIWVRKEWDGGRSMIDQRVNDEVEQDLTTGKWKVIRLYPGVGAEKNPLSDIRRFKKEWNAFHRGLGDAAIGTPLEVLFGDDPARIEYYKACRIRVLEQLEHASATDLQNLGMGARDDQERVKRYFAKQREIAPMMSNAAKFEELLSMMKRKDDQISELTDKLTQVLNEQVGEVSVAPKKRGRPAKVIEEDMSDIEGA